MGQNAYGAQRRAPEILAATADRYRVQASDVRRDVATMAPDDDSFYLTLSDARELERAADLLDAVSRVFHQRSDMSPDYQLPRLRGAPTALRPAP